MSYQVGSGSTFVRLDDSSGNLESTGGGRFTGYTALESGVGIEIGYISDESRGTLIAYDRNASQYKRLDLNERITILGSGNVGIGTTVPLSLLHINSSSNNHFRLTRSTDTAILAVGGTGTSTYALYLQHTDDIFFMPGGTESLRLTKAGNVGIGTTIPASPFHVHGPTNALMQFTDNDSGATSTSGFQVGIDANEAANLRNYGNTPMLLSTNNIERMRITPDGYSEFQNHMVYAGISWSWIGEYIGTQQPFSICYGNGKFVTAAYAGEILSSCDGINWTTNTPVNFNVTGNSAICYGNGIYVVVAITSASTIRIATSHDLINWSYVYLGFMQFTSVCYGNGVFVAVTDNGYSYVSPDGINWTGGYSTGITTPWHYRAVCFGYGIFVTIVDSGEVMTSPDGITWTIQAAPVTNWSSVCYGGGIFVAVALSGGVMTSPNGITWTYRGGFNTARSICYGDGLFVAVGGWNYYGSIMTSPDGITWTARIPPLNWPWNSVCYGNGIFVSCGNRDLNGLIMVSGKKLENVVTPDHDHDTFLNSIKIVGNEYLTGNLLATGNIGIGTTIPASPLHVHGSSKALMQFTDNDSGATSTDGFQVGIDANEAANLWNYGNTPMFLATDNTAQVTILANGNVGIGTTNPTSPFYVVGDATVTGNMRVDGSMSIGVGTLTLDSSRICGSTSLSLSANGSEKVRIGNDSTVIGAFTVEKDASNYLSMHIDESGDARIALTGQTLYLPNEFFVDKVTFNGGGGDAGEMSGSTVTGVTLTGTTAFVIDSGIPLYAGGRVGIGTTDPSSPLHVIGDSTITGNLQVNGLYNADGTNGITGWADDGTNFRLFFTNGLITSVTNSTAGGHS